MITLELRAIPSGATQYSTVATMTITDDGNVTIDDPDRRFPLDLPVLVSDGSGTPRRVGFEEDPSTYARNLRSVLRTGYLVPAITHDDGLPVSKRHT